MTRDLNEKLVFDTFNFEYNEERFKLFIRDLLVDANFAKEQMIQPLPNEYRDFIRSAKRICKYEYIDPEFSSSKVIDVLVVKLKKSSSVERARTAQRNFISRYLNGSRNYQKDAALVAFISEDENGNISPDWRFSFIQMNYVTKFVETPNGKKKLKTEVELTPAKRFSFLVGVNEDTHTAQQQLKHCLDKSRNNEKITIEDLVQAFDIEKVSKEFFEEYKKLYLKLVDELKRLYNSDEKIFKDFNDHNINIDDFAKKTMGQLVFLYFIQKKGWLGVKVDKDWGTGDKKFLRKLFDKDPEFHANYNNFFNDILEHLFYEALASDRDSSSWFGLLNCRIPFLNGGLFEPVNGYEWTKTDLTIDNNIFKDIFDTFDLYNFTVKEDEPLEKEVAIDPEMLGKVFENLLPENIRKGNGAFYTPREIVHYMCQESLINYLYNKINIKQVELSPEEKTEQQSLFKKKKIDQLKLTQDVLEEIITKEDIEFFIKTGTSTYTNKTRKICVELPESIVNNAKALDKALSEIKVCDPAIGSGAFPVGMMNEIVRARAALSESIGLKDRSMYELKRNAIENSIYGVDIDAGAVDIAKLRFWLSLVVDEEDIKNIKPLPNLDYKIMQGNSLITSYEGIDFDEIVANQPQSKQLGLFSSASEKITDKISLKQQEFLKTPHSTRKGELKQEIENLIVELVKTKFEEKAEKEGHSKNFYEETIRHFAQNKENRNFFPWKLFFADAFEKGGFNVVIANPPYLKERDHQKEFEPVNNSDFGKKYHQGKMDFWYYFLHKAIDVVSNYGIITFITPRYWLNSAGAKKLRTRVKENLSFVDLVDIGKLKVFDDVAGYHMTATYCKTKNYNEFSYHKLENDVKYISAEDDNENKITMSMSNTDIYSNNDEIILAKATELNINTRPLSDECNIVQGVVQNPDRINKKNSEKYGFNLNAGVFVLTKNELDKLNLTDNEYKFVKIFLEENAVNKYYINKETDCKFLLYLTKENCNDIEMYPNIKRHLLQYKVIMDNRRETLKGSNQWFHLHWPRKQELFEQEKLVLSSMFVNNKVGYDNNNCYFGMSSNIITLHKDSSYSLKCVLGILNSRYALNWFNVNGKKRGAGVDIGVDKLRSFPIPTRITNETTIISTVDRILELTNSDDYMENYQKQQAVKEYENQIDIMVYKLYDLTYSEVKIIDPEFPMSEEEYNNING